MTTHLHLIPFSSQPMPKRLLLRHPWSCERGLLLSLSSWDHQQLDRRLDTRLMLPLPLRHLLPHLGARQHLCRVPPPDLIQSDWSGHHQPMRSLNLEFGHRSDPLQPRHLRIKWNNMHELPGWDILFLRWCPFRRFLHSLLPGQMGKHHWSSVCIFMLCMPCRLLLQCGGSQLFICLHPLPGKYLLSLPRSFIC